MSRKYAESLDGGRSRHLNIFKNKGSSIEGPFVFYDVGSSAFTELLGRNF